MPTPFRHPFLDLARERVVILDGGMGTSLHKYKPTDKDWGYAPSGKHLMNLSDALVYTHPEWIKDIHRGFFAAGCDGVETNTFNASQIVLDDFGMGEKLVEINRLNIKLAKEAAAEFATPDRPRFVVGSIGPGTKMPSIIDPAIWIDFDSLAEAYRTQIRVMIEERVDAILIETCFDLLQAKCVAVTAIEEMKRAGVRLPLMVQLTIIDANQKMLPGTDVPAALVALEPLDEIDVIGMNCGVGPDLMLDSVRHLSRHCGKLLSVLPNAGLPETRGDETYFPMTPTDVAEWLERFVSEFGVNIIGGCCGTNRDHLAEVAKRIHGKKPTPRTPKYLPMVSSLLAGQELLTDPRPLLVGERTNTNGSKKFKQLLEKEDWHGLTEMAREQEREGVHVLDVCVDYVGRDGVRDMRETIKRYNAVLTKPIMLDSTEVNVIEAGLKLCSGKAIINSINLEDGRKTLDPKTVLAKKYGAGLVALTIDEKGQADTAEWKFEVAKRIYDIVVNEYGIPPTDLMFDPLVFPVSTGMEQTRKSAIATFEAIKLIKQNLPGALTHVGLSNCSFGLTPYTRQVLNSMYLHYALEYGLDSAILHAAKIMPLSAIDERGKELCRRLLFDDRSEGDPLQELMAHYADKKTESKKGASLGDTVEERLRQAVIQGRRETLIADLDLARERYSPLDIINKVLLDGMRVVGDLFGSGQMQLPFVLQSAEVMKAAVAHLEQFMEKVAGSEKGKIVLATVKGDVHDIGKNLVDIILTNNGYKVYNLGIKQPVESMIAEFQRHGADAIGMSGLLVKSTVIMKEDLITLNERGLAPPVILGGAALNRRYVEQDLREIYRGQLYYGEDAFEGLRVMDELAAKKKIQRVGSVALKGMAQSARTMSIGGAGERQPTDHRDTVSRAKPANGLGKNGQPLPSRSPGLPAAPSVPKPPFLGSRVRTDFDMTEVFGYLNELTLFSTQWGFEKGGVDPKKYAEQIEQTARPALARLKEQVLRDNTFRPAATYGFFPAAGDGTKLTVFADDHATPRVTFDFPRQEFGDFLCLADYVEPLRDGRAVDYVSFMAVTMGHEATVACNKLRDANKYQDYLFLHGLAVESAEALAELFHKQLRAEWGIGGDDAAEVRKLFKGHYRGRRYAFGYPACPNLEDQAPLFALIDPTRVGITLTDTFQLEPEQSTTAVVVHHPKAKYFNVLASQGMLAME
ncbi:methionine synthase : 5-methyltetrahydrofolate--homocysteine S-methyltransferase OS=Gloeobacter violaceus (strain PCC 7421) GN=metH PE=4 SV=1: S-methyl_trans: Pterin_bind: B12-binding_2: B12-binding: Met_synt_B12 [Gemmataceae bacterium]|nr:methionine synthase : 5-methyltetrahydrofolate--homocysteine S-methyltransferase OS=Gloeobacter violaceus (strain PCC 7421) GN=metH PE=4 SV=1: S-methyl_trans: Pterin_bind: B12-binding_2: B12-binding: Met_synt_B12 [Gemmataceae bacterium]VTT98197.1 methionine synthase : 5-methyltetrahydrofolate--homocysteine S-methyltransferase OS=Gloeobacter violaceus (strain PCC 7421) GN=metH PE=4 SV=1: S-methyl_trans: Pterin_bind: B12-binding_2: B12-binding: Met_synt_B12 [Gemmataceae bacterium]